MPPAWRDARRFWTRREASVVAGADVVAEVGVEKEAAVAEALGGTSK